MSSRRETFFSEIERLRTFQDRKWPLQFLGPDELAKCGFFYLGVSDRVQCPFCGIVIFGWQNGDLPIMEHKILSGKCPFINGRGVGNIFIDMDPRELYHLIQGEDVCGFAHQSTTTDRVVVKAPDDQMKGPGFKYSAPMSLEFITYDKRLSSFKDWPASSMIAPATLAESGFYYQGPAIDATGRQYDDYVTCFHCGISLCQWAEEDDPWKEHEKFSPTCPFVLLLKQNKLEKELEASPPEDPSPTLNEEPSEDPSPTITESPPQDPSLTLTEAPSQDPPTLIESSSEDPSPTITESPPQDSSTITEVPSQNPSLTLSEAPSQDPSTLIESPSEDPSPTITEAPSKDPSPTVTESPPQDPSPTLTEAPSQDPSLTIPKAPSEDPSPTITESPPKDASPSITEAPQVIPTETSEVPAPEVSPITSSKSFIPYLWLPKPEIDDFRCKICFDYQVGVTFHPCLHTACPPCAAALANCPICRTPISRVIKLKNAINQQKKDNKINFYI